MKIAQTKISNKTRALIAGALILSSVGLFSMTFADVPVRQNDVVQCLCVTSNSQTCVTSSYGNFVAGDTQSSCDADGNYSVTDTSDKIGPWYDPAAIGNSFLAIGNFIQKCDFNFENGAQRCTSSVTAFNGAPLFSPLEIRNIGDDSGIKCLRSGNTPGTLKLTGTYLTYFSIGGVGGDGAGGGASGDLSSGFIPLAHNFSCY